MEEKKSPAGDFLHAGPGVAHIRLSVFSIARLGFRVKGKMPRTLSARLFGERRELSETAGTGLEPASPRLTDGYSTIELPGNLLPIHTVSWPGGLDLSPESLYREISGKSPAEGVRA